MHRTRRHTLAAMAGIRVHHGPARRDDGGGDTGDPNPGGGGNTDSGDDSGDGKASQDGKTPKIDGDFDPDRHARALAAAREGEKKAKAEKKASDDRLAAVLKAAGLTSDGKQDPAEQLRDAAAERDTATAKARDTAIELAVYKRAGKAGADPDAILDSRGFLSSVKELDPDAADFGDKITAAIKAAVKTNGKLAATGQGPARQGADHTGGGTGKGRSGNLTDAVKRKLGG